MASRDLPPAPTHATMADPCEGPAWRRPPNCLARHPCQSRLTNRRLRVEELGHLADAPLAPPVECLPDAPTRSARHDPNHPPIRPRRARRPGPVRLRLQAARRAVLLAGPRVRPGHPRRLQQGVRPGGDAEV